MKKILAIILCVAALFAGHPVWAEDGIAALYANGTVPAIKSGTTGTLDSTSADALVFHSGTGGFSIPYSKITAARFHEENRFRLGVLPAIAVGLLKARAKRYTVTITWTDERGLAQVAEFEMPRQPSMALVTLVRLRAPQVCAPKLACVNNQFD
jgi:hypothetical protein